MNKESHPYLLIWTSKGNRKFLLSSGDSWTIGRDSTNHCIIREKWISRNHALIEKIEAHKFCLTDLSKSNGSYVNGRRVDGSTILKNKDKITFGRTKVEFYNPVDHINDHLSNCINSDTSNSQLHKKSLLSAIIVELNEQELLNNELDDNVFSILIDDWFSQTKFIFYQRGIVFNQSIGNSLTGIKFHQYQLPEKQELLDLFQAAIAIENMTSKFTDKYFLSYPLKIGISLNTGEAMVKTNKTYHQVDYDIFGSCIDNCFYLKSAFPLVNKNFILGEKTYSYCSILSLLTDVFEVNNNPLRHLDHNQFIYSTNLNTLTEVFQVNPPVQTVNNIDKNCKDDKPTLPDSVQNYLVKISQSFHNDKIETIVNFDLSFELKCQQKEELFNLLTNKKLIKKLSQQVKAKKVEFTYLVFEPLDDTNKRLSYSNNLCQEIEQEFIVHYQLEDYFIIDIPPNLMGQAQIYHPSHLCAIYRRVC